MGDICNHADDSRQFAFSIKKATAVILQPGNSAARTLEPIGNLTGRVSGRKPGSSSNECDTVIRMNRLQKLLVRKASRLSETENPLMFRRTDDLFCLNLPLIRVYHSRLRC